MKSDRGDLSRLSLNRITTKNWPLPELVKGCAAAGLGWVGLWRDDLRDGTGEEAATIVQHAGLRVSSLCRGGFFPAASATQRALRRKDNRKAVNQAATLGTDTLVLVTGGMAELALPVAREMVAEGILELAPYAADHGVKLAIEPLHPMFCADRSVVVTLAQAVELVSDIPVDQAGVVVDTFHLWWDPDALSQISSCGDRIYSYQVCDWLDPLPDLLLGRGLMGDGTIDFRPFGAAVTEAGYEGPVEVEIFNADVWNTPGPVVLESLISRYVRNVLPSLGPSHASTRSVG